MLTGSQNDRVIHSVISKLANKDKFIKDIVAIYNSAWSVFKEDFTPLDPAFLNESLEKAKAIIDEELIWFAYYNDKPIAFFILFPDLTRYLKFQRAD